MKKLLTICLLMAITLISQAQQKPTKEETIAFINRTVQEVIGFKLPFSMGKCTGATFSFDAISFESDMIVSSGTRYAERSEKYQNLRWDLFKSMAFVTAENTASYYDIRFSSNFNAVTNRFNKTNGDADEISKRAQSNLYLFIPSGKASSVEKAILRLVEIAKEENKDPFQK